MAKVTYIEFGGRERVIDVKPGLSVMEGAVHNGVPGILADCGGACSCATCHVYVDSAWANKLPPKDETEEAMLECVMNPEPNSRLSCQIKITEALDGLVVRTPEKQV
jgi:2Fe-2S ferredoxin